MAKEGTMMKRGTNSNAKLRRVLSRQEAFEETQSLFFFPIHILMV